MCVFVRREKNIYDSIVYTQSTCCVKNLIPRQKQGRGSKCDYGRDRNRTNFNLNHLYIIKETAERSVLFIVTSLNNSIEMTTKISSEKQDGIFTRLVQLFQRPL